MRRIGVEISETHGPRGILGFLGGRFGMIRERVPQVAESVIARLHHEDPDTGCVGELRVAAATLDRRGFLGRPQWDDLRRGVRPPPDPRLICGLTQVMVHPTSFAAHRPALNSASNLTFSAHSCWRGYDCPSKWQRLLASVERAWTVWGVTELLALVLDGCAVEL